MATKDVVDLVWSVDDRMIFVWDNCLEYRFLVYSPDGRCLHQYEAYDNALGIKVVALSPSGAMIVIGSYDQKVRNM
jgi:hypothetical protein